MTTLRTAKPDEVAEVLRRIAGLSWPIPMDDEPAVVEQLGWTVVPGTEGRYLQADTGWGLNRSSADFASGRIEQLTSITFRVTDIIDEPDAASDDFPADAFADVVAAALRVLGEPSERSRRPPTVTWLTAGGGSIAISHSDAAVTVNAYSAKLTTAKRTLA